MRSLLSPLLCVLMLCTVSAITPGEWDALASSCKSDDRCQVNHWTPQIQQACGNDINCIALVKAFMVSESAGNPFVVSHTGCAGLMQLCRGDMEAGAKKSFFDLSRSELCCPADFSSTYGVACGTKNNMCKMHGYTDPRFDVDKNVLWATQEKLLKYLRSDSVNGNLVMLAIAYNMGPATTPKVRERISGPITLGTIDAHMLEEVMLTFSSYRTSRSIDVRKKAESLIGSYIPKIQRNYLYFGGQLTEDGKVIIGSWTPKTESSVQSTPSSSLTRSSTLAYGYAPGANFRGALGSYSVWPGIKLIMPVATTEMALLRSQAQTLYKDCSGVVDLDVCVAKVETLSSLRWSVGDCPEMKDPLDEMASVLSSCMMGPSDNCLCELPLPDVVSSSGLLSSSGETDSATISLFSDDNVIERFSASLRLQSTNESVPLYRVLVESSASGHEVNVQLEEGGSLVPLDLLSKGGPLALLKNASQLLVLKTPVDVPACAKSRYRTFCVRSGASYYPSLTIGSHKQSFSYRFAMYFPSSDQLSAKDLPVPAPVPSTPAPQRTPGWKIVVVGDSLSAKEQNVEWPYVLDRSLPDYSVTTTAVVGRWTRTMLEKFPQEAQ